MFYSTGSPLRPRDFPTFMYDTVFLFSFSVIELSNSPTCSDDNLGILILEELSFCSGVVSDVHGSV